MSAPRRLTVLGSCVSRDSVEFAREDAIDLLLYIARQSLVSIGSDASPRLPADLGLTSPFQVRQVQGDWAGTALAELEQVAADIDLLLWDIVDERNGVYRVADSVHITNTIDVMTSEPLQNAVADAELVTFGTDDHFELWSDAADRVVLELRRLGLLARTRLLMVPWAERMTDGSPSPWSFGVRAADGNRLFERYYLHLSQRGVSMLTVPRDLVVADPGHKWGSAPFHYVPEVYRAVLSALQIPARDAQGTDSEMPEQPAERPSER